MDIFKHMLDESVEVDNFDAEFQNTTAANKVNAKDRLKSDSKILTEGPGAGYTIYSCVYDVSGQVTHVVMDKADITTPAVELLCDVNMTGTVDNFSATAYENSTGPQNGLPISVSRVRIIIPNTELYRCGILSTDKRSWQASDLNLEALSKVIEEELYCSEWSYVFGGGYQHVAFDGVLSNLTSEYCFSGGGRFDTWADIKLTDESQIEWIDKAVRGENLEIYYEVADDNTFSTLEDAIDYAKDYGYDGVYQITYTEDINGDTNETDCRLAWTSSGEDEGNVWDESVSQIKESVEFAECPYMFFYNVNNADFGHDFKEYALSLGAKHVYAKYKDKFGHGSFFYVVPSVEVYEKLIAYNKNKLNGIVTIQKLNDFKADMWYNPQVTELSSKSIAEDFDSNNDDYDFSGGEYEVQAGGLFIEDGVEYEWVQQHGDVARLDFDAWAVWEAADIDADGNNTESKFFIVDIDTGFIDWGPCDTLQEAQEFLQSKIDDYNSDEDDFEVTVFDEDYISEIETDAKEGDE